jgi:hypothetical protein
MELMGMKKREKEMLELNVAQSWLFNNDETGVQFKFAPNTAYNCRLWLVFAIDGLWEIDQ